MIRIFIDNYEFKKHSIINNNNLNQNIKFIFDNNKIFIGTIYKNSYNVSIRFSKFKRKNSRLCIEFFKQIGIDLNKENGVEKLMPQFFKNIKNLYYVSIPYPPAFPIFKRGYGLLSSFLRGILDIENNKKEKPSIDFEKDIICYCKKYCILVCNKDCPLNKYNNKCPDQ